MKKMDRQGVHDLLERVLNGSGEAWTSFALRRDSQGNARIKVAFGDRSYEEERPFSEIGEVIARAKAATDE